MHAKPQQKSHPNRDGFLNVLRNLYNYFNCYTTLKRAVVFAYSYKSFYSHILMGC